ncbi:hypothetical protein CF_22 [Curtobacterium phage Ayka]|nr:hypothetical protein CF_22 [Curtobacterium phage Ayka]
MPKKLDGTAKVKQRYVRIAGQMGTGSNMAASIIRYYCLSPYCEFEAIAMTLLDRPSCYTEGMRHVGEHKGEHLIDWEIVSE